MNERKITIDSYDALKSVIVEHGGGIVTQLGNVEKVTTEGWFICQVKCNDGTIVEFSSKDGELASKLIDTFNIDSDKVVQEFLLEILDDVSDSDPFVFTIKGLVYLESLLLSIIEASFLDTSYLELDRIGFEKKVMICVSAGLIHKDVAPSLRKLARIRNQFAHQYHPSLTEGDELDFINILRQSERLREMLLETEYGLSGVRNGFLVLYMYLLGQIFKVAKNTEFLFGFWRNLVDVSEDDLANRSIIVHPSIAYGIEANNNDR